MSKFTDFLKLFKWDTKSAADLEEDYDIDTAVNPNWDKIDENAIIVNERLNKLENNGIVSNKYARALPGKVQDTSFEHIYADSPVIENLEIKGNIENVLPITTENWEVGSLTTGTGQPNATNARLRTKNFIAIESLENYYCNIENTDYKFVNVQYYNADMERITSQEDISSMNNCQNKDITTPENTAFIKVVVRRTDGAEMTLAEIENINPIIIKKIDEISVDITGKNFINSYLWESWSKAGLVFEIYTDGKIKINGTITGEVNRYISFTFPQYMLGKKVTFSVKGKFTGISNIGFKKGGINILESAILRIPNKLKTTFTITQEFIDNCNRLDIYIPNGNTVDAEFYIQLELGEIETEIKLYKNKKYTITLPESKFLYIDSCIKKINNKWNLVGNETVELPEATQIILNNIQLYEDINNIGVEDGTISFKYNKSLVRAIEELYILAGATQESEVSANEQ